MTSLFISYSRKDIELARKLTEAFKGQDLDFWIDWEGIAPTVDWWKEIQKGIEEADIFLFLISPDSARSKICQQEIEHAIKNGKRLIPIVVRDIKADESPSELSHLNWIFLRDNDDFNAAFSKLIIAIKTDFEWAQAHRQIQVKSLEWERNNHENSFLLRGKELQEAELLLATNSSKEPYPTDLQREYLLKSRQTTDRQRRITTTISIAGIIALAVLAVFGFVQAGLATASKNEAQAASTLAVSNASTAQAASTLAVNNQKLADERAKISRAGELAAQSVALPDRNFVTSLLLGIEAFKTYDTIQTSGALIDNVQAKPQLQAYLSIPSTVNSVAFSPDGKTLASGSSDNKIILWNVIKKQPIGQPLNGHTGSVNSVAFSPDGKTLASGSSDNNIILWNVETGQPIGQPLSSGHGDGITSIAFSPYGTILVAGSNESCFVCSGPDTRFLNSNEGNYTMFLWNVNFRQPIAQLINEYQESVTSVAFSPDGKTIASGSNLNTITLWNMETRKSIGQPLSRHTGEVTSIAFNADGKLLISGSNDNTVILWDVEKGQSIGQPLNGHAGTVTSVAFNSDGKTIASASTDNTIILWDISTLLKTNGQTGQPISRLLKGDTGPVESIAFSQDGKTLVSVNWLRSIIRWDVETGQPIGQPLDGYISDQTGSATAFSHNRKILASNDSRNNSIILRDMDTGQPIDQPLRGSDGDVRIFAFSPDDKILASASYGNTINLWDVKTGELIGQLLHGNTTYVSSFSFSPDGKMLASSSEDDTIILWDVKTKQPIGQPLNGNADNIAFSPDGKTIVMSLGSSAGNIIAFSPNGKTLAFGNKKGTIILWDVETERPINEPFYGHIDSITSIAFSPDGIELASGSMDGTIIIWNVKTGKAIGSLLSGYTNSVNSLAFGPDGKTLVSNSYLDNTILLWDMDPLSWIIKTCQRAGRNLTRAEWVQYFPDEEYRITCSQWPGGK